MTLKGGGLFVMRSVVDLAGGMYGGQKSSASGGRWNLSLHLVCFTGKAATGVHCNVCASVAHLAADCPLTQEDQDT